MHEGEPIRDVLRQFPRLALGPLPPYAPDLDPVERLWNYLRYTELPNFAPQDTAHLDRVPLEHLRMVRREPSRLRSFYRCSDLPFPRKALAA
jgi:hypothetical protein